MTSTPEPEELFGQRVRRRRKQLGISLRELAERMQQQGHQWHHTTVARTESADRPVRLNEAVALAGILRMPLFEFSSQRRDDDSDLKARIDGIRRRITTLEDSITSADYQYQQAKSQFETARLALAGAESNLLGRTAELAELNSELDHLNAKFAALDNAAHRDTELGRVDQQAHLLTMLDSVDQSMQALNREAHPSRAGSSGSSAQIVEALKVMDRRRIDLMEALKRIKAGTYGQCVDCGKPIPEGRLQSSPDAVRCLVCQPDEPKEDPKDRFRRMKEPAQLLLLWKMSEMGMGIGEIAEEIGETDEQVQEMLEEANARLNAPSEED